MIFLNSIKILFNNFILGFKSAIYKFIAILISCAIIFAIAFEPLKVLSQHGVFTTLWSGIENFSFFNFFDGIIKTGEIIIETFSSTDAVGLVSLLSACAVGYILFATICNFDKLPICEVLDGKMSSNCKLGFTGTFFSRLWFSVKYTFTSLIFYIPFDCAFLTGLFFSIKLFKLAGFWLTVAPFVVILLIVLYFSLRLAIFSNWVPYAVSSGRGVWKSFGKSFKTNKKFFRTFGNSVLVIITVFFFNMMMLMITAGVGLVLTLPASILFINGFSMVNFYVCTGNRFYIDAQTIVSPRKLETQEEVKNLIDLI